MLNTKSNLLKNTVVRFLLFGIPFSLSYLATRPAETVPARQPLVVCAYPTDRPGELRISLDPSGCADLAKTDAGDAAKTLPARRSLPAKPWNQIEEATIPF